MVAKACTRQLVGLMVAVEQKTSAEVVENRMGVEPAGMVHLADSAAAVVVVVVERRSTAVAGIASPALEEKLGVASSCDSARRAIAVVVRIECT